MNTTIIAQIASIPERSQMLKQTVMSLYPQVDELNVMLNNYKNYTPYWLSKDKINVYHFDNSKGDGVKFYGIEDKDGYVFTCDDDIIYPTDYVHAMTMKLAEYNNRVILTNHGRVMNEKPVRSSYMDRKASYHCMKTVTEEIQLDIGGTGVMAFYTDYFRPDYNSILFPNMADIWIAKFAKEQGCKILMNPHEEGWLVYQNPDWTIWDQEINNHDRQTEIYNSF